MDTLFDISYCQCKTVKWCSCRKDKKVCKKGFDILLDQRSNRILSVPQLSPQKTLIATNESKPTDSSVLFYESPPNDSASMDETAENDSDNDSEYITEEQVIYLVMIKMTIQIVYLSEKIKFGKYQLF